MPDDDRTTSQSRDAGRTVLGRISAIMDAFDERAEVLSLNDLSEAVLLPKSTVHRLAEQLRGLGWLERDHRGYRVGMRIFELGGLAMQHHHFRDIAFPHLYALAMRTNLAVQMGVLDGGSVVYLERIVLGSFTLPTRLGGRMPAYCTALGKAMLAFDEVAAQEVLHSVLPRRTAHTITDPAQLECELAEIRRRGIAFDHHEAVNDLSCVAAPIRNSGRAIGAVSVTGPEELMTDKQSVAKAVQATAAEIWVARFNGPRPRHQYPLSA